MWPMFDALKNLDLDALPADVRAAVLGLAPLQSQWRTGIIRPEIYTTLRTVRYYSLEVDRPHRTTGHPFRGMSVSVRLNGARTRVGHVR